jgi:DNA repair protein RecO (recombination protein O)
MHWSDRGVILSIHKFDEVGAVVRVLTATRGVCAGVDKYALSSRKRGTYQIGNLVEVEWKARLPEHLGTYRTELVEPLAAYALDDALKLTALQSASEMLQMLLHERDPHPDIYDSVMAFLFAMRMDDGGYDIYRPHPHPLPKGEGVKENTLPKGEGVIENTLLKPSPTGRGLGEGSSSQSIPSWIIEYVRFEFNLLTSLGFGLDLESCAATGMTQDLRYVSPKSGRAVSVDGAQGYENKLLKLPPFLLFNSPLVGESLSASEAVGGHGIEKNPHGSPVLARSPTRGEQRKDIPSGTEILDGLRLCGYFLEARAFGVQDKPLPLARIRFIKRCEQRLKNTGLRPQENYQEAHDGQVLDA